MPYRRRQPRRHAPMMPRPAQGSDWLWRLICALFLLLALGGSWLAVARVYQDATGATVPLPRPANPASRSMPGW
jgi:hypothetical protein